MNEMICWEGTYLDKGVNRTKCKNLYTHLERTVNCKNLDIPLIAIQAAWRRKPITPPTPWFGVSD